MELAPFLIGWRRGTIERAAQGIVGEVEEEVEETGKPRSSLAGGEEP